MIPPKLSCEAAGSPNKLFTRVRRIAELDSANAAGPRGDKMDGGYFIGTIEEELDALVLEVKAHPLSRYSRAKGDRKSCKRHSPFRTCRRRLPASLRQPDSGSAPLYWNPRRRRRPFAPEHWAPWRRCRWRLHRAERRLRPAVAERGRHALQRKGERAHTASRPGNGR